MTEILDIVTLLRL